MLSKILAVALLVVGISAWGGDGLAQVSASHVDDKGDMLAQVKEPSMMAELLRQWTRSKFWPTRGLRKDLPSPSKPCQRVWLNHSQISLRLTTQETHENIDDSVWNKILWQDLIITFMALLAWYFKVRYICKLSFTHHLLLRIRINNELIQF